jgi:GntR family transcriptional regulator, transcriptional repressor for pyruvate dehydrogenase complex
MPPIPLRSMEAPPPLAPDPVFTPVRSQTAFEETLERLGTAIRLGLLEPGARLPAERELCAQFGISRSTLRQALAALVQSGHLHALRGRRGGTFVAEQLPPGRPPSHEELEGWREVCDGRLATELGVAVLACRRAAPGALAPLEALVAVMQQRLEDFPAYRHADVRFHVGLAETTGSVTLVAAMTEAQGAMGALIDHIAQPPEVLASFNLQHRELLAAVRAQDVERAARVVTEHLEETVHVLAGLLPIEGGAAGHN